MINGEADDARTVLGEVLTKHFTAPGEARDVAWYADALDAAGAAAPRRRPHAGHLDATAGHARTNWRRGPATTATRGSATSRCARSDGQVRFAAAKSPLLAGTVMRLGDALPGALGRPGGDLDAWLDFHAASGDQPITLRMAKLDPQGDFSSDYEDLDFQRTGELPHDAPQSLCALDCVLLLAAVGARGRAACAISRPPCRRRRPPPRPTWSTSARWCRTSPRTSSTPAATISSARRWTAICAPKCFLLRPVAEALARVEHDAARAAPAPEDLGLLPPRPRGGALRALGARPRRPAHQAAALSDAGQVAAARRLHRAGLRPQPRRHRRPHPAAVRAPTARTAQPLDMGTDFDFFDVRAHTDTPDVTAAAARQPPAAARRDGSAAASATIRWNGGTTRFTPEPTPHTIYDVPVQ